MDLRDYRKGNWNLQETMILIEAKRMDDERRTRRLGDPSDRGKPAELRWKWVEDYCWKNGCLRSQNQCNDKWDNLMRDFKKVREYENRIAAAERLSGDNTGTGVSTKSYWRIEKTERKDNNLPSNMLPQIYNALAEVTERRGHRAATGGGGGRAFGGEHAFMTQSPVALVGPPPAAEVPVGGPAPASLQALPTVDSDTTDYSGSPAKRRRRRGVDVGEGTSRGTLQELGSAISKSASIIAEAIQSSEERSERRHRDVMRVHERRLQIEETNREDNGLVDAINKLANSIFALAAHNNNKPSSSK